MCIVSVNYYSHQANRGVNKQVAQCNDGKVDGAAGMRQWSLRMREWRQVAFFYLYFCGNTMRIEGPRYIPAVIKAMVHCRVLPGVLAAGHCPTGLPV